MSYADTIAATLKAAAQETYRTTFEAGSNFGRAHGAVRNAEDLVDIMARMIDLAVASEALHNEADLAVKHLRAALAEAMAASGAASIHGSHHAAHLARKPAFLNISDEAAIPRSFYVQPPPQLDRTALKAALKDGTQVPGVSMLQPNEMSLRLVAKKESA